MAAHDLGSLCAPNLPVRFASRREAHSAAPLRRLGSPLGPRRHRDELRLRTGAARDGGRGGDAGGAKKDVEQLWRTELPELDSMGDGDRDGSALKGDIARQAEREARERRARDGRPRPAAEEAGKGLAVRAVADKLLVAAFFFVVFSLAWLVAGLAERAALQSSSLIDSWLPLWPALFQPALGFLMAGAIFSAVAKKT